jgi:hypothetical protein
LQRYKTEEEVHHVVNHMISIIKGHEVVTISNLEDANGKQN